MWGEGEGGEGEGGEGEGGEILPQSNLHATDVPIDLFHLLSMVALPVYVTPQFTFAEGTGKFNIKVGLKQTMGKVVR